MNEYQTDSLIFLAYLLFLFVVLPSILTYDEVLPKKWVTWINKKLKVKEDE